MNEITLVHLANFNSENIGNGALILGTERVLREDLGRKINFIHEPWGDYTALSTRSFDEKFVELVNGKSDGLVVGAAVTLDGRAKYRNTGMRFDLPLELWGQIKKPIIFYAISYRHWPFQTYHNVDQLSKTIKYIISKPQILFSVRNDGTKEWLESLLGYGSEKIIVIPDPALYVSTTEAWHPELQEKKVNIIISLNNEDYIYRYGGKARNLVWRYYPFKNQEILSRFWQYVPEWKFNRKIFLRRFARVINMISDDREINLILCPHSINDYGIMEEFTHLLRPELSSYRVTSASHLPEFRAGYFYDLYKKASLAISMRIHSMCPAIGVGTPVITLDSRTRMSNFMKDVKLEEFALDIFDSNISQKIYERCNYVMDYGKSVRQKLEAIKNEKRRETRTFNHEVASHLGLKGR